MQNQSGSSAAPRPSYEAPKIIYDAPLTAQAGTPIVNTDGDGLTNDPTGLFKKKR